MLMVTLVNVTNRPALGAAPLQLQGVESEHGHSDGLRALLPDAVTPGGNIPSSGDAGHSHGRRWVPVGNGAGSDVPCLSWASPPAQMQARMVATLPAVMGAHTWLHPQGWRGFSAAAAIGMGGDTHPGYWRVGPQAHPLTCGPCQK